MKLSPTQREAIRDAHDSKEIPYNTWRALERRGLMVGDRLRPVLTGRGQAEYERIMESGDGPEDLKELFRF